MSLSTALSAQAGSLKDPTSRKLAEESGLATVAFAPVVTLVGFDFGSEAAAVGVDAGVGDSFLETAGTLDEAGPATAADFGELLLAAEG